MCQHAEVIAKRNLPSMGTTSDGACKTCLWLGVRKEFPFWTQDHTHAFRYAIEVGRRYIPDIVDVINEYIATEEFS